MRDVIHDRGGDGAELSAESLTRMSRQEIESLYADGDVPDSLEALDGEPRGLVLAVTGLDIEPVAGWIRRLGSSEHLPWEGKSFRSHGDERGEGANRIRGLGEVAAFATAIEPSAVDGRPCISLDYDRPDNPWPIRKIRDELREVSLGLYLGPAMLELGGRRRTILYFAVDTGAR